ncbi:ATP-binding protein [Thalassolituus marinus]|nr:ATP-binding protein [Thalassolituus marinus]
MMSFSLGQLGLIVLGYLFTLFFTAYAVERGWVPRRWVRHPLVYVFSLGVYASAWAFYGSVGMASHYGYGFLAYYLGISGAFIMSPILLRPLLHITRIYQLSSLADLLAFRYRSRLAGMLVSIFTLAVIIPMLTLQISAVADTLHLLNGDWPATTLAFGFCMVMVLFAVLFGARHVSPREKHEGLVFALAFESLVKLVAILILGGVVLFGVFPQVGGLEQWLTDNQALLVNQQITLQEGPWRTLLIVFFAAAIVMPHMFHVTFTENINTDALKPASWGFPLFLLLMSIAVPPILWAGVYLEVDTPPEYFALGIGLQLQSPLLVMITFLGGLAAASGVMIVMTLATAAMFLNHLVLPFHKPSPRHDFYRWLLWMRRALIAGILLLAYTFYRLLGVDLDLNRLGILAFVAALQFLPGVLGLLYWPKSNRKGFLSGLIVGIVAWLYGMLLPFSAARMGWNPPFTMPAVDESNWHLAAVTAIGLNVLLFVVVSLSTKQKASEISAADACSIDTLSRPSRRPLIAGNSNDVITALSKPLGRYVAEREVYQALTDLDLPSYEDRPYALRRLRARLEANLSGLMGPTVAHDIVTRYLPFQENAELSEDIYQIEQRLEGFHDRLSGLAGELDNLRRYHRQTLERLPMGVCSLADDGEILMWNQAMTELTGIQALQVTGAHLSRLPSTWSGLLQTFVQSESMHEHKKQIDIDGRPRWYSLHKSVIKASGSQPGGIVVLMEDQTETQMLEEELIHSERLASIGRLAAGVAHEIGNPITGIDCLAQNIRYETENPELLEIAGQIQEQTKRVSRILQSLMNFAHAGNHSTEHEPVAIAHVVEEAMQLLRLSKRSQDIEFVNQCDNSTLVLGDPQRLVQVFVNLLSNARDASEAGQKITVSSSADEHQIVIRVIDEGHGIEKDKLDRIFEPFFTTKEVGKGTGLGLSLVYNIIEEHYGHIAIESPVAAERGTCVKVSLPSYQSNEDPEPAV